MNWRFLRLAPWLDTRSRFVAGVPQGAALLDIGSSDGSTLGHIAELRPDLRFFATDIAGAPEAYPEGCQFARADIQKDRLPWEDGSLEAITCMHLVEHLTQLDHLFAEVERLLKPGGRVYFETPHPRSMVLSSPATAQAASFTLNFFDDLTHVRPVSVGALAKHAQAHRLNIEQSGTSRNWLFALAYLAYAFCPPSRQKYTARVHFVGWSAYLVARKRAG